MKENADKARGLDAAELAKQLREGPEQIFRLRFQLRMGQADGLKKLRVLRKDRARMLTVLRERELGGAVAPAAKAPVKAKAKVGPVKMARIKAAPRAEKAVVKKSAKVKK
jgi:large subunit ribosomal protein L29